MQLNALSLLIVTVMWFESLQIVHSMSSSDKVLYMLPFLWICVTECASE